MASELLVNKITPESGTTLTLGESGDTISFASGVLPSLESLTITGDLTVDTNTLFVDSTNNRVGVGTASPSTLLDVSATQSFMALRSTGAFNSTLNFYSSSSTLEAGIVSVAGGASLLFTTGSSGTERMRIDSSGNVLIGKTSLEYDSTAGTVLRNDGFISAVRSNGNVTDFNRLTSDGEVVRISKDGTTVGSIGSRAGTVIYITSEGTNETGLDFGGTSINPMLSGSLSNGTTDLGNAGNRFKDLYLSGNLYLGGTGSANALDDYEEGTWTPTVKGTTTAGTGSYSNQDGSYVKVGSLVTLNFDYALTSHTGSGFFRIAGLPFSATSTSDIDATGVVMVNNFNTSSAMGTLTLYLGTGSNEMRLYLSNDNTAWAQQNIDTAHNLIGSITYRTDS